jgi:hypothetical protein
VGPMSDTLGERFARALAAKDFGQIKTILHPAIDFRGMTPGRFWEASDAQTVIDDILQSWFEDHDVIDEVLRVENDHFSDRERVGYRFALHNKDGAFVTEQHAFYTVEDGRITWMRVLCSGYRPAE